MKKPAEEAALRGFCRAVFEKECALMLPDIDPQSILFRVIKRGNDSNGQLRIRCFRGKYRFRVSINLRPLLKADTLSDDMKRLFLYATVVHELAHIDLLLSLRGKGEPNFFKLFAAWDQVGRAGNFRVFLPPNPLLQGAAGKRKRKITSASEWYCNTIGFCRAYASTSSSLTEREKALTEILVNSLDFIVQHLEISYNREGNPRNLFLVSIKQMQSYKKHRRGRTAAFQQLDYLLHSDGSMLSVEELLARMDSADGFYSAVLLRVFLYLDLDWSILFEKVPDLKEIITALSNEYCENSIRYLTQIETGTIFLPESVLRDNAAMLIKNDQILNRKMKQYGIARTTGGVLPLYNV